MITLSNYNTEFSKLDLNSLPQVVRDTHEKLMSRGAEKFYGKNEAITKTIDDHLKILNTMKSDKSTIPIQNARQPEYKEGVFIRSRKTPNGDEIDLKVVKGKFAVLLNNKIQGAFDSIEMASSYFDEIKEFSENAKDPSPADPPTVPAKPKKQRAAKKNTDAVATPKAKKPKSVAKAKPTKTKAVRTKPVQKAKDKPAKQLPQPKVHRKIKSPELMVLTRFHNLPKGKKSVNGLVNFSKQIANALANDKYAEHKAQIEKVKKIIDTIIANAGNAEFVNISFDQVDTKFMDRVKATIGGATERLRVSFLSGIKKKLGLRR